MFDEPDWFHHNGKGRLVPQPIDKEQEELVLFDNYGSVVVSIRRFQRNHAYLSFRIKWKIPHVGMTTSGDMQGVPPDTLRAMFGKVDTTEEILDKRGGTTRYVRQEDYLNIPGKNCNGDGDPNLSIFISPEIRKAVEDYLALFTQIYADA